VADKSWGQHSLVAGFYRLGDDGAGAGFFFGTFDEKNSDWSYSGRLLTL